MILFVLDSQSLGESFYIFRTLFKMRNSISLHTFQVLLCYIRSPAFIG